MSTARFNTLQDASGGNNMPVADINQGRAKAWLNMNGSGTIAARDSFNVSSLADNGVGDYTANFGVPMPNANHAPQITGQTTNGANNSIVCGLHVSYSPVASSVRANIHLSASGGLDRDYLMISVDGDPA